MAKGVAAMYVSESFETVLKNRELKLDKKDLGNDGIAFLGLYSEEDDEFPSCLMTARTVPITKSLMKESEMGKT